MKKLYNLCVFILLIIPHIKPQEYVIGSTLSTIYDWYKIISIILIFILYIHKNKKISKMLLAIMLFQFTFIFSTLINGSSADVIRQCKQFLSVTSICMLTEYGIKTDKINFFKAMYFVLAIYALINSFTMFKYSDTGMYVDGLNHWQNYFLGYDNSTFLIIFPVYIYAICYSYMKYKKISLLTWGILLIIGLSYFYVESTTAMFMLLIFLIYMLTYKLEIWNKILNFDVLLAIVGIVFVFIVLFNGQLYFQDFMEETLNKNVTISGRTYIWGQAKKYIAQSPIIGYGSENNNVLMSKFGINHIHNMILDILYNGGIIAMSVYIFILYRCRTKFKNSNRNFIVNTIILGLFIYLFTGIFDYNNNKYILFTLFILAEYSDKIIEEKEWSNKCQEQKVV